MVVPRATRISAPAKVNLRLRVLARETSGFHSIETIFAGVSLADQIEIEAGDPGVRLEVQGEIETGPPEKNLVVLAAHRFFKAARIAAGVTIRLEKRIPAAAGLGGGSSDAAATLRALNAMYGSPCARQTILDIAAELGSDVPFFLVPTPFALGWGHGERLLSLEPPPERQVLIANPGVGISTPAAFDRLDEIRGEHFRQSAELISISSLRDWSGLEGLAHNDLYAPALERMPRLADAESIFRDAGARIAMLSGSGPSVFGIFDRPRGLRALEDDLAAIGFQLWSATTLREWAAPEPRD